MKLSIVVPVYQDGSLLQNLYNDLYENVLTKIDYEYEIVLVNDGSTDNTLEYMHRLKEKYGAPIKVISLSRNFGAYAAVLCGLTSSTGDCAVVKAADCQEPSSLILDLVQKWNEGNNVVLAVRDGRDEKKSQVFFSNLYYKLVRKFITPNMPPQGFDVFLLDRKAINILDQLDERNSSLILQILWIGFKSAQVPYHRVNRNEGVSKWTMKKKLRLVMDTFFSFSNAPLQAITGTGVVLTVVSTIINIILLILHVTSTLTISYAPFFIFIILMCTGIILVAIGILGEYQWRILDACRNRPVYIKEENNLKEQE